ncbi:MAG: type II toxin-antitoxin system VapC family toxin [Thermoleophilaceae bacterium]|nr:type II toxin-antitoxin system VapC family toxin [Thermoleophilaceae bacterium]
MQLVDANVLVYAVDSGSPRHERARGFLDAALAGQEAVGFAWTVALAFLRVTTLPAVFERPLDPADATSILEAWLSAAPAVAVEPTPRHLPLLAGLLRESGTAGNLVNDAHLAALALEHDAEIVTFDRDFGRFGGVRATEPPA